MIYDRTPRGYLSVTVWIPVAGATMLYDLITDELFTGTPWYVSVPAGYVFFLLLISLALYATRRKMTIVVFTAPDGTLTSFQAPADIGKVIQDEHDRSTGDSADVLRSTGVGTGSGPGTSAVEVRPARRGHPRVPGDDAGPADPPERGQS